MRFNRKLKPFKAISFDLDDTLYSNRPVMQKAEFAMVDFFHQALGRRENVKSKALDYDYWFEFRQKALLSNPELSHDVGALRHYSYILGMQNLAVPKQQAKSIADKAMQYFIQCRCDFEVPQEVHQLLLDLAKKWPLIAITNGNLDTQKVGIDIYFKEILHANLNNKQKPNADMFIKACNKLNIKPEELLHIGDCGYSDIYGANAAGCQSIWLSCYDVGKPITRLPTCEIHSIGQLKTLLIK